MPAISRQNDAAQGMRPPAFHVMTKPIGPLCNLDCKYCFYLEKENLFPSNENFKMRDDVLESYVRQYIGEQAVPEITFAWQGGEPTLMGVDFFRRVVALQKQYGEGRTIHNAFQTNGTLLDDSWGAFLSENRFLVGLSVDGPAALHDTYRVDKGGRPTFGKVMDGLAVLKKHGVEFNTLTVVNRLNSARPGEVYRFLKEIGSGFIQFIPLVERRAGAVAGAIGLGLAQPPAHHAIDAGLPVTEWSVEAGQYGTFLVEIFDEWVRHDVGRVFVQVFDVALGNWMGLGGGLCVFSEKCGTALALEHNGDLFSCDHYVYPEFKLGNIMNQSLGDMAGSEFQRKFGSDKKNSLPAYCRRCEVRFACHGECPKHRFMLTPEGEPGLNYLCPAYKKFFNHIDPFMRLMGDLLNARRAPAEIMQILHRSEHPPAPGPNHRCPCGSGKRYKRCCGKR